MIDSYYNIDLIYIAQKALDMHHVCGKMNYLLNFLSLFM